MNQHILKGKWNQVKGDVQKQWGKLTHNDLEQIQGELTRLEGVIQEKYGETSDEIKSKLKEIVAKFEENQGAE